MRRARGMSVAAALSVLVLGGLFAPAIAQTSADEECGPYTGRACPDPEDPNGEDPDGEDPNGETELPEGDPEEPNGESEEPSEVDGEVIEQDPDPIVIEDEDEEEVAVSDTTQVLGEALARTGVEAWMFAVLGLLLIGGGVIALRVRRRPSEPGN